MAVQVIAYMTLGIDVSPLFSEMVMAPRLSLKSPFSGHWGERHHGFGAEEDGGAK